MAKHLFIDTNLLLLFLIGSVNNGELINYSKRLQDYTKKDFFLLQKIMRPYKKFCISPYIATEISNLLDINIREHKESVVQFIRIIIPLFNQINSKVLDDINSGFFYEFGITDAFLCEMIKTHDVLTNDKRLKPILYSINYKNVVDFQILKECNNR